MSDSHRFDNSLFLGTCILYFTSYIVYDDILIFVVLVNIFSLYFFNFPLFDQQIIRYSTVESILRYLWFCAYLLRWEKESFNSSADVLKKEKYHQQKA